ncbi:hypothetical protein [Streptomyces mayteni]
MPQHTPGPRSTDERTAPASEGLRAAVMDPTRCAIRTLPQPGTTQVAIINVHVTHAVYPSPGTT